MPLGNFKNSAARAARAVRGGGSRHWRAAATHLRNRFFTGFAVAIPLIVTIWLLVLSYRFILFAGRPVIDGGGHLLNALLGRSAEEGNLIVPPPWFLNLFGILVPVLIFIGLGVMATNVLGARVISLVDRLLLKFPVISSIYAGLKQVMDSFKNFGGNRNFQRVAYIEYPAPGCRLLHLACHGQFNPQEPLGLSVANATVGWRCHRFGDVAAPATVSRGQPQHSHGADGGHQPVSPFVSSDHGAGCFAGG